MAGCEPGQPLEQPAEKGCIGVTGLTPSHYRHLLIANIVNGVNPGSARYVEISQTDHHFRRYESAVAAFEEVDGTGAVNAEPVVTEIKAFLADFRQ